MNWTVRPWMLALVVASNVASLLAHHFLTGASTSPGIATVALDEVILAARNEYARTLMDAQGAAKSGEDTETDVHRTWERIDAAVARIQQECQCVLLARGAVVPGESVPDYTRAVIAAISGERS